MTGDKRSSAGLGPLEVMVLVCAAAVLALEGGLWLWAGTAGTLFGSGWPHLSLGGLWHAITGVGGHLSDPRMGFPASVRPGLPGPAGFYAALALLEAGDTGK